MRNFTIFGCKRYVKYIALALLFCPLSSLASQGNITVNGQSLTIKQIIQIIEKSSDYSFFYNGLDLENVPKKDISCNGSIEKVLHEVFSSSGISYVVKGKEVILKVEKTTTTQQTKKRTISGTVTDASDGTPIIGANIVVKGENTGVISDMDGNFSISVPTKKGITLEITYIGYKKREIPVEDLGVINIKLESDNEVLDEVVIVGSGTQKKVSVTGSITSVKGLELKAPSSSLAAKPVGCFP